MPKYSEKFLGISNVFGLKRVFSTVVDFVRSLTKYGFGVMILISIVRTVV